jgi:hypothetical protein
MKILHALCILALLSAVACSRKPEEQRLAVIPNLALSRLVQTEGVSFQETRLTATALRLKDTGFRLEDKDTSQHLTALWRYKIGPTPMEYTVKMVVGREGTPSALLRLEFLSDKSLAAADCNFNPQTGVSATRGDVLNADRMVLVGDTSVEVVCTAAAVPGAQLLDLILIPGVGEGVTAYSELGTGQLDVRSISLTAKPLGSTPRTAPAEPAPADAASAPAQP